MTAKEMFEELGFKFTEDKLTQESYDNMLHRHKYRYFKDSGSIFNKYDWLIIEFNLKNKSWLMYQKSMNGSNPSTSIEMDLFKAIQKQIEELGW